VSGSDSLERLIGPTTTTTPGAVPSDEYDIRQFETEAEAQAYADGYNAGCIR
jgi:hypothetical protein